jgi:hypothetical protein
MLLAPQNARTWAPRVRRIIFDEIHCIGQAEDGLVWEQLLLLAPCPIIALSATVGNPDEFADWLRASQNALGHKMTMIRHQHRYSDLRKFVYRQPAHSSAFTGLADVPTTEDRLSLDDMPGFDFVHPIAGLVNVLKGIPEDLSLEARDCLTLARAMSKHWPHGLKQCPDVTDPVQRLPTFIKRSDIINWNRALKAVMESWQQSQLDAFRKVVLELGGDTETKRDIDPCTAESDDVAASMLPLLSSLHTAGALPALIFNYDRYQCENIAKAVLGQLVTAEAAWKDRSPVWRAKLESWQKWKEVKERKGVKTAGKAKGGGKAARDEGAPSSKLEAAKESAEAAGEDPFESFDPDAPVDGFTFADAKRLARADLAAHMAALRRKDTIAPWLLACLERGIGVHHAGMNIKYRHVVEMLFRRRFLRAVVATGTLALGINMPCATVVFAGDSVFLTALNFRQAAGRAGRRGFDRLGSVVLHRVPRAKVQRLLSSRLPALNGHFPVTTSLVLRLCALLHSSRRAPYAVRAVQSLLGQPRLYVGGASFRAQVLHHLRFSIEYLRRCDLLGADGAPLNFAGCVSHLYFTENASFGFHALLRAGYFHELCAEVVAGATPVTRTMTPARKGVPATTATTLVATTAPGRRALQTLMLVMAHLFGRRACRRMDADFIANVVKRSPSIVFLPPLPRDAAAVLRQHNRQTLDIFAGYVKTFVAQHVHSPDDQLPLTKWRATNTAAAEHVGSVFGGLLPRLPAPTARSAFVALSGHDDRFSSIADLCHTVRDGVFLEQAVIPHVGDMYPTEPDGSHTEHSDAADEEGRARALVASPPSSSSSPPVPDEPPLNAYLYDFFMHGDVAALQRANGIRRSDVWFLLKDFSLVLATIVTSLANFMKLDDASDMDIVGAAGGDDPADDSGDEDDDGGALGEAGRGDLAGLADGAPGSSGSPYGHAARAAKGPTPMTKGSVRVDKQGDSTVLPDVTRTVKPSTAGGRKKKAVASWEDDADDGDVRAGTAKKETLDGGGGMYGATGGSEGGGRHRRADAGPTPDVADGGKEPLRLVLAAFRMLRAEFDEKFMAMWA